MLKLSKQGLEIVQRALVAVPAVVGSCDHAIVVELLEEIGKQLSDPNIDKIDEYVTRSGMWCPSCGATDVEGRDEDFGSGEMYQEVSCNSCGAIWNDRYVLTDFCDLETTEQEAARIKKTRSEWEKNHGNLAC